MKNLLHEKGLKATPLRVALLTLLTRLHRPLTAEEIATKLKETSFDRATLFRCLKDFSNAGLVTAVDLGEGFLRYEAHCEEHHHHHHIICTECKKIEVVPVCIPDSVIKHLQGKGFRHIQHRIDFSGICSRC